MKKDEVAFIELTIGVLRETTGAGNDDVMKWVEI